MPVRSNTPTLVIIHDGFSLHGVVISSGSVTDLGVIQVPISTIDEAVASVVHQLGKHQEVVLVTSDATVATLQLPHDMENSIAGDEFSRMLEWEMQPYVDSNPMTPMLGQILVSQGALSHQQLANLIEIQKQERVDNPASASIPIGESAIAAGLLDSHAVDNALRLQSSLHEKDHGGELVFGLSVSERSIPGQNQSRHVAAMLRSDRAIWNAALKRSGISANAILPLTGIASSTIANSNQVQTGCVIEIHNTSAAICHLANGKPVSFEVQPLPISPVSKDQIRSLIDRISSVKKVIKAVNPELTDLTKNAIEGSDQGITCDETPSSLIKQIADSAIGFASNSSTGFTAVPIKDPPIPFKQRAFYKPMLASICIATLIVSAEMYMKASLAPIIDERDRTHESDLELHDVMDQVNQLKQETATLDAEIKTIKAETLPIQLRNELIGISLDNRTRFHSILFEIVANSVGDEVILDRLSSRSGQTFQIEAWSLTQAKADEFVELLATALAEHQMAVVVESTREAKNRLNLNGRQIILNISPITVPVDLTDSDANDTTGES